MAWRDLRKRFKQQISEFLEIPSDVMLDLPKIVLVGNLQVIIENHRGILQYQTTLLRIGVSEGELVIQGENLVLRNVLAEEICVEGEIKSITFLGSSDFLTE